MYLQDNLKYLKKHKISLYQYLNGEETNPIIDNIKVTSVPTRTEIDALEITSTEGTIRLNSKFDPLQEATRWVQQFNIKNLGMVAAMFGLGNGLFLRELLKLLESDSYVIVYEPSYTVFTHVLERYQLGDLLSDERVLLIVEGINDSELPIYISQVMNWMNLYSRLECCHPGYDKLYRASYDDFHTMLQDNMLESLVVKGTHEKLTRTIVNNSIRNMQFLKDTITFWDLQERLPKDVPVIIVSAGPSLLKNIEVLRLAKGKAIIIAVDRAYDTLQRYQIEPDFVANIDANKNVKATEHPESFTVPLLCKLEGSYQILSQHRGKKIFFDCSDFMRKIYLGMNKKFPPIATGGSITTAVFTLMAASGFQRIVFVGSDLAYQNGLSHAGMDQLLPWDQGLIELYVDDIDGNKVKTRFDWYSYLRWLEAMILQFPDCDFIDATEGGARIQGTRLLTLKEVVEQHCNTNVDCRAILESVEPTFNKEELHIIMEKLFAAREEVTEIREKAQKTIYDCQKLITNMKLQKNESSESRRLVKRLFTANAQIEGKSIFSLLDQYILSASTDEIGSLNIMSNDKQKDEMASYETTELIYRRMLEGCDLLLSVINKIIIYHSLED